MSVHSGGFHSSNLVEVVQALVKTCQTGYLKIKLDEQEGLLAVENGTIINARTGSYTALHALFQFVGWRDAHFDFHERPLPETLARDLEVYDPQVLLAGMRAKVEELAAMQNAMPSFDAIPSYHKNGNHGMIQANPIDLDLLSLANGRRTVREIADLVKLSPAEIARCFARFRLAGLLEIELPKTSVKTALAATG